MESTTADSEEFESHDQFTCENLNNGHVFEFIRRLGPVRAANELMFEEEEKEKEKETEEEEEEEEGEKGKEKAEDTNKYSKKN